MLKTNADHARLWPCYNSKSARERTQTTIAEIRRPRLVAGLRYLRGQTLYNYQIFIGPYGRVVCDSASVCWICYKRNQPNVKHMVNIVRWLVQRRPDGAGNGGHVFVISPHGAGVRAARVYGPLSLRLSIKHRSAFLKLLS